MRTTLRVGSAGLGSLKRPAEGSTCGLIMIGSSARQLLVIRVVDRKKKHPAQTSASGRIRGAGPARRCPTDWPLRRPKPRGVYHDRDCFVPAPAAQKACASLTGMFLCVCIHARMRLSGTTHLSMHALEHESVNISRSLKRPAEGAYMHV